MNAKRDANFYMANLGSEMTRLISARDRGDQAAMVASAERCLSLANQAIEAETIPAHRNEIAILKGVIADVLAGNPQYTVTQSAATAYFYPFALRQSTK